MSYQQQPQPGQENQGYYSMPNNQHQYTGGYAPPGAQHQHQHYQQQPTSPNGHVVIVGASGSDPNAEWKVIMMSGLFGCFDDITTCLMALCFPICLAGSTQSKIGAGSFLGACLTYCCCAGCQRSAVQNAVGVPDSGCVMNWCVHCFCACCALAQEARAADKWVLAGKPAPVPGAVIVSV